MNFNLQEQAFSTYGSYLAFSYPFNENSAYKENVCLRVLYGEFENQEHYPLLILDELGKQAPYHAAGSPAECVLSSQAGELRFCYQDTETVHFTGNCGVQIDKEQMDRYSRLIYHKDNMWEFAGDTSSLMVVIKNGTVRNESRWNRSGVGNESIVFQILPDESGRVDFQIRRFDLTYHPQPYCDYNQNLSAKEEEFNRFLSHMPEVPDQYLEAAKLALYINWSGVVEPEGYIKAPAILMTKSYMNFIWSWDYTFNALAMCKGWEELAYDQYLAMVHVQDEDGAYPDCFHARKVIRGFVKPPVQGFILERMMEHAAPSTEVLSTLYDSLTRLTGWWLDNRAGADGLPMYFHGNDSGWDNGTVFAEGVPVKSPDICTWLILQMDFLKEAALKLGKTEEAEAWGRKAAELLAKMLEVLVQDGRFIAKKIPENRNVGDTSLLLYVPLLLGTRLPEDLRQNMLHSLLEKGRFKAPYGYASEALDSGYFEEDGYWRGAVWPPLSYIVSEILRINGYEEEALDNAKKYCDICGQSGFAENYSALDGRALRDTGYTWTTSIFLVFLRDYLMKN
ncbi:hypothetical protein A8L34_13195 [Bacillus sp. FJAT-27264]|uniref:MGH1-like glycoside hydrolase domain-containing protein n=1 Tax=Paenibacillus sp. (strain DSM 101736 / FJAT-27264) TaxID=1850362 RepID=UPI000807D03E|nr:hypothetical protein [Bacillus sp. FJAT-27264]OBZ14844.1 hypothetical protein A8L34_13195 [Bacillus sp. FJAT-27264]